MIPSEVLASGKQISFPSFNFYNIRTFVGKYFDISKGSTDNRAFTVQYAGNNSDNQKFFISNDGTVAVKQDGRVLDVYDGLASNDVIWCFRLVSTF
ncbi:TPA: RICIN domain-containing protein [Bacillus cereus]